jgi:hypothetical protein
MKKLWTMVTAAVLAVTVGMLPGDEPTSPRREARRDERAVSGAPAPTIDWFSTGGFERELGYPPRGEFEGTVSAPGRTLKRTDFAFWNRATGKERAGIRESKTVRNAPAVPHWASRGVRPVEYHWFSEPTR